MNSPLNSFIQESHHQNLKIYVLVYKLILKSNYALTKFYETLSSAFILSNLFTDSSFANLSKITRKGVAFITRYLTASHFIYILQ